MRRRKILWQLMPAFLLTVLIALTAITSYALSAIRDFYEEQARVELKNRAWLLENAVLSLMDPFDEGGLKSFCAEAGRKGNTRVTVIDPKGKVVGDSHEDADMMDNHIDRPEIKEAMERQVGYSIRKSQTLKENMVYVAIPLEKEGRVLGVLRTSLTVTHREQTLGTILTKIVVGGLIIAF
ncbi:MAG: PAS domain-containing sensor histidine kinase, partial [Verrucomicrobiota bacterium]